MVVFDNFAQPFGLYMGIDLGRRDIRMTQHLLHRAKIGASFQQMAGETVAQHMGRNSGRIKSGFARQAFEFHSTMLARQVATRPKRRK